MIVKLKSYYEFLQWVAGLGPIAPQFMGLLSVCVMECTGSLNRFQAGVAGLLQVVPPMPTFNAQELSVEEASAQEAALAVLNGGEVLYAAADGPKAWDGTVLLQIWQFIQANPAIVQFIIALFAKKT